MERQGDFAEALQSYREALAIAERLAKADPSKTLWQHDLSGSYDNVGNVLKAQGKLAEALQSYRKALTIAERLAKADPSNTEWQIDLSIDYDNVGDVLKAQGNLAEALQWSRDGLTIRERLAKADPTNTRWQRDLSISYNKVGDVLVAQGNLAEALQSYRESLAIRERLAKADVTNAQWQNDLRYVTWKIGGVAYKLIFARDFSLALETADQAIALTPDIIRLHSIRAHALMFLDRVDDAREVYLKYRGQQNVQKDKSWETVILEDFAELQKAGLTHPLMQEIEKVFAGS